MLQYLKAFIPADVFFFIIIIAMATKIGFVRLSVSGGGGGHRDFEAATG